jgi:hypothetical protein
MRTHALRHLAAAASLAGALLVGACGDFNVTNPNQPTQDDLSSNPTRTKLAAAATGILIAIRTSTGAAGDITGYIWRLGSMGREGVNLSGNNQPDYIEPYFGPLSGTGFGGTEWTNFYRAVRSANIYLDAAPKAAQLVGSEGLSSTEVSASLGFGKTLKALAFMYIVAGHGSLGAPVDVDHPVTDPPAPFVSEDSVYGYIIATLNDAQSDLTAAGATPFPFPMPPGFSGFDTPAGFIAFNRALAAKAYLFRATALNSSCGGTCYPAALAAITAAGPAFGLGDASQFKTGAYFDYSAGAGDTQNELSDALDAAIYFAVPEIVTLAQKQTDGTTPDARVMTKTAAATPSSGTPQQLLGIPIIGTLKFTIYLTGGNADPAAPIPIIRNEELVLLRAEANIGLNDFASALTDINFVRTNAGNLSALGSLGTKDQAITELLYNRRYSLLWEQGATWVDARRYGRIVVAANGAHQIPGIGELPGFGTGNFNPSDVPLRLLVPDDECRARGLESGCSPLGT